MKLKKDSGPHMYPLLLVTFSRRQGHLI